VLQPVARGADLVRPDGLKSALQSMARRKLKIREGFPGQRLVVVPPRIVNRAAHLPVCRALLPTHIGRFDSAKHHFVERKNGTPEYIFIACLSGAGRCWIQKRHWNLEEGHAVVLPPGIYHRYEADEIAPWTIFWIHFRGRDADAALDRARRRRTHPT
jgi:AraC family transcriptional regulator, arabinose operon regulatory protein